MDLHNVVQKLNQFVGVLANVLNGVRLLDAVEVKAYLLDAAPGWSNNAIELFEVLDEEPFHLSGINHISAVGHRLSTAGLPQRIANLKDKPLQEFKGRNADFGKHYIDVTRNKQTDLHAIGDLFPTDGCAFCSHGRPPLMKLSI